MQGNKTGALSAERCAEELDSICDAYTDYYARCKKAVLHDGMPEPVKAEEFVCCISAAISDHAGNEKTRMKEISASRDAIVNKFLADGDTRFALGLMMGGCVMHKQMVSTYIFMLHLFIQIEAH